MTCRNSMSVCAVRASRLNSDGTYAAGASGAVAMCGGIGKVTWTPQFQTGDDITELDGCGNIAVARKYDDKRKRYDIELDMITYSYELLELITGATLLTDGGTVGYADLVQVSCGEAFVQPAIALEAWGEAVNCDGSSLASPYTVQVFPFIGNMLADARTLQRGVNHIVLKGSTKPNANFASGPFGDLTPLAAIEGWDHAELDADALPSCDPDCGYVTLVGSS